MNAYLIINLWVIFDMYNVLDRVKLSSEIWYEGSIWHRFLKKHPFKNARDLGIFILHGLIFIIFAISIPTSYNSKTNFKQYG